MKRIHQLIGLFCAAAAAMFVVGCEQETRSTESLLAAAGFQTHVANTAQKQKLLASLPPDKITTIQRNGHTYYVFPNLKNNSALVGTQTEYQTYLQLRLAKNISDQNLQAAQLNSMPPVGWGAWGGWAGAWGPRWGWR
jgi:hypothetical protein